MDIPYINLRRPYDLSQDAKQTFERLWIPNAMQNIGNIQRNVTYKRVEK